MFKPVKWWEELKAGDLVWEIGSHDKEPRFYGPFEVVDTERRVIRNREHREWTQGAIEHFVVWRPMGFRVHKSEKITIDMHDLGDTNG